VITRECNCDDCLFPRLIAKRKSDVKNYRIIFPGQTGKNLDYRRVPLRFIARERRYQRPLGFTSITDNNVREDKRTELFLIRVCI